MASEGPCPDTCEGLKLGILFTHSFNFMTFSKAATPPQGTGGCPTRGAASRTTSGKRIMIRTCHINIINITTLSLQVCQHGHQAGDEGLQGVLQSQVNEDTLLIVNDLPNNLTSK